MLFVQVALDKPIDALFDYRWDKEESPQVGQLVWVPFGPREVMGVIIHVQDQSELSLEKIKDVLAIRNEIEPVSKEWLDLCRFAAGYYQRTLGEVVIPSLPKALRQEKNKPVLNALSKIEKIKAPGLEHEVVKPALNEEQLKAVQSILESDGFSPILLHGVTGSGKTEVYLRVIEELLQKDTKATVLVLVPEINLTPQLESHIRTRFPNEVIALLHSQLSDGERLKNWLLAHSGKARIILGTRMAILVSVLRLDLIIVDEEHDNSYKQQEGLRYSARDLAVWRAWQLKIPIVLGSATPSLETWYHAKINRYRKLSLPNRAVLDASLPRVQIVNVTKEKLVDGLSEHLIFAIEDRLKKGEQSLLFLNRRGYAPVLRCEACGWVSSCTRCSAYLVLHMDTRCLRCHHCGLEVSVYRYCPDCGNSDLKPLGRGTQRIEETLTRHFPTARILRIDADSTRKKGSMESSLAKVHQGEVDILVGTQMLAKGHDFKNVTFVGALNSDVSLFSHDYRASERLFAQLMQVGGRAGRRFGEESVVMIQTRYPEHLLYQCLKNQDYERYITSLMTERQEVGLPPFMFQALLFAEAKELTHALEFLRHAKTLIHGESIIVNDPVPLTLERLNNQERAQLLIESANRKELQVALREWLRLLRQVKTRANWHIEVDPLSI